MILESEADRLLGALGTILEALGYARAGAAFRRRRASHVVDIVQVIAHGKSLAVAVGICFPEVVEFARRRGKDWYSYVGELPEFPGELFIGSAQLIQNLGHFGEAKTDLVFKDKEAESEEAANLVTSALRGDFAAKVEMAGDRNHWIDNWTFNVLAPALTVEVRKTDEEHRDLDEKTKAEIEDWHRRSWAGAFVCWGSPAITAAIVANCLGRKETVDAILEREIVGYETYRPRYAAHLKEVRTLLIGRHY